jgi:hypothetical protein
MFISYGGCSDGGFGGLDELDPINVAGIASPSKSNSANAVPEDFIIESTEIWALEPNGLADSQSKLADLESE